MHYVKNMLDCDLENINIIDLRKSDVLIVWTSSDPPRPLLWATISDLAKRWFIG